MASIGKPDDQIMSVGKTYAVRFTPGASAATGGAATTCRPTANSALMWTASVNASMVATCPMATKTAGITQTVPSGS